MDPRRHYCTLQLHNSEIGRAAFGRVLEVPKLVIEAEASRSQVV